MTSVEPNDRARWRALTGAFLGWMCAGVEMSLMVAATKPAIQDLLASAVTDPGRLAVAADEWFSWYLVAFLLGAAAGGALFGWLGDRWGRVRAMGWSILTFASITAASYFVRTPTELLGLRFLACLGVGGMWPNGIALVLEVWPAVSRPVLAGLIGAAANVGFLLLGVVMIFQPVTPDTWRWVLLFGGIPVLLGAWVLRAIPESPDWRESRQGGSHQATSSSLRTVFQAPFTRVTLLGIALGAVPLLGGWASGQRLVPWAGQVVPAAETAHVKAVTQVVQATGAVIGSLFGGWFANRVGNRKSYLILSVGSLVLSLVLFGVTQPGTSTYYGLAFALGVVAVGFFGWLPYYLPALFPTAVRATGCGVAFNFGRIASAATVLITAPLSRLFEGDVARMGLVTCFVYALGIALSFYIPAESRPA